MEIDRVTFLQNIKIANSSEETNELMRAIRDGFSHLMACYNLFISCIDIDGLRIIDHADDYSSINILLSKSNSDKIDKILETAPQPVTLTVYGDYFSFNKLSSSKDGVVYTLQRLNLT